MFPAAGGDPYMPSIILFTPLGSMSQFSSMSMLNLLSLGAQPSLLALGFFHDPLLSVEGDDG